MVDMPICIGMEATILVEAGLHGNVKVTILAGGRAIVNVWKLSEAEARAEAEAVVRRMGFRVAA